jgi:hypothetical protein
MIDGRVNWIPSSKLEGCQLPSLLMFPVSSGGENASVLESAPAKQVHRAAKIVLHAFANSAIAKKQLWSI